MFFQERTINKQSLRKLLIPSYTRTTRDKTPKPKINKDRMMVAR